MHFEQILGYLWRYFMLHAGTDEFVVWSVLSAVILNMPVPGSPLTGRTLYEWLYNALHQFANTGKTQRPTQPASEPEKK